MNATMTWQQAVQAMAANDWDELDRSEVIDRMTDDLKAYGRGDEMGDWIADGSWDGSETAAQVQADWDEYLALADEA